MSKTKQSPLEQKIIDKFDEKFYGKIILETGLTGDNKKRKELKQFLSETIDMAEKEFKNKNKTRKAIINGKEYETYLAPAWCSNCNKNIKFDIPIGYKVGDALSPLVIQEYKPKCPICGTQSLSPNKTNY